MLLPMIRPEGTTTAGEFDEFAHYKLNTGPLDEFADLPETPPTIRNIGWTLGNDCPYRCTHCYSMNARVKGQDMSIDMIDRIVTQLRLNHVETVNLGGNEPIFTNGLNPAKSLLPYIVKSLVDAGIEVGLTTSGVSLIYLYKHFPEAFELLNDVDVSLDSPYEELHDKNRGAKIYYQAIEALGLCAKHKKPHTVIMCGMNWNFDVISIDALVEIANVRINPMKPVMPDHMASALTPEMYYRGFSRLLELCDPVDLGEPPVAAKTDYQAARRCPCGRTSFRIHSITPTGEVHVSPCVYLHDYKAPLDLLKFDLIDIINSPQFRVFRQRNRNPESVAGCDGCELASQCGGGCAARSYLHTLHETGQKTFRARDPYCPKEHNYGVPFPQRPSLRTEAKLVHMDYLCTWIGTPK
jgi:radical SAM protein with 4Fe4S-binding SPASM domain